MDALQLQQEVLRLRTRIQKLIALLRVLLVVLKISQILARPDPTSRREGQAFPATGDRPGAVSPSVAIRVTHHPPVALALSPLEPQQQCALDDRPSCPRLSPQQLTPAEVQAIHDLATSQEYRHVPTGTSHCL